MSRQNLSSGSLTRSDTNQAVQPQKMARGLKFRVKEEELYYLCNENKGADQLPGYCTADLRLCFCICIKQVFSWHGCDEIAKEYAKHVLLRTDKLSFNDHQTHSLSVLLLSQLYMGSVMRKTCLRGF